MHTHMIQKKETKEANSRFSQIAASGILCHSLCANHPTNISLDIQMKFFGKPMKNANFHCPSAMATKE